MSCLCLNAFYAVSSWTGKEQVARGNTTIERFPKGLPHSHKDLAYCGAETTRNTRSHRARPIRHRNTSAGRGLGLVFDQETQPRPRYRRVGGTPLHHLGPRVGHARSVRDPQQQHPHDVAVARHRPHRGRRRRHPRPQGRRPRGHPVVRRRRRRQPRRLPDVDLPACPVHGAPPALRPPADAGHHDDRRHRLLPVLLRERR